jgi:hypothetical protein
MMVIFTTSFSGHGYNKCHIKPEDVERVFIKVSGGQSQVFINNETYTCYCGEPGESVHIYKDQVMVCCEYHRPTCKL